MDIENAKYEGDLPPHPHPPTHSSLDKNQYQKDRNKTRQKSENNLHSTTLSLLVWINATQKH